MNNTKHLKELIDCISFKSSLENKIGTLEDNLSSKREELIRNQASIKTISQRINLIKSEIPIIQEELQNWTSEIDEIKNNPSLVDDLGNWKNGLLDVESNLKDKYLN